MLKRKQAGIGSTIPYGIPCSLFLILAVAGCQAPAPTQNDYPEIHVEGIAPGQLRCTLTNPTPYPWSFLSENDAPSVSVQYWTGEEWEAPIEFHCLVGTAPAEIQPGGTVVFIVPVSYSRPRVSLVTWDTALGGADKLVLRAELPGHENTHPYVPVEMDLERLRELRQEMRQHRAMEEQP